MAICDDCKQEMLDPATTSCTLNGIMVMCESVVYERDSSYFDNNQRCHDCGIENKPGNIHHQGCDMEQCPICGGQLISCGCLAGKDWFLVKIVKRGT